MKKRIILSSVITMLLCLCMIGGATYALFTSETSVNIAVTSGKVKVEAGIENLELYSMGVKQAGQFELGGTAVYDETTGMLTLTNVAPGDKVVFDIVVENSSNIDIQYKANWTVEGKLNEVLVATANDKDFADVDWTVWKADAPEKKQTIKVVVELPIQVGNEYQEQVASIAFRVEAIQANGFIKEYVLPSTIANALAIAEEGDEIELGAGYYDEIVVPVNGIKLFSREGAEVGFLNVNGKENVTIQGLTFDAAGAQAVVDNYKGGTTRSYANIAGASKGNTIGARNLVIDGCTFTGEFANSGAAIAFADRARPTGGAGDVTIKNCTFATTNALYDIYGYYTGNLGLGFVIENNTFASKCVGSAIYLGRLKTSGNVEVNGNTFQRADALENAVAIQGDGYTPVLNASNNTFGSLINYATPATIASVLATAQEGYVIELAAGYYAEIVVPKNGIKLFAEEEAEVGFLNVNGKDNVTIQGLTFDAAGAKMAYDGRGSAKQYANIAGASGKENGKGNRNLVIDGCTFAGAFANGGVAIAFVDQGRGSGQSGNITIKNCEFATTNSYYDIYCHYSGFGSFVIENNEFASECLGIAIYLGRYQSSTPVVVKGNTFANVATLEDAAYIQDHSNYGVSFDASGNTFGN